MKANNLLIKVIFIVLNCLLMNSVLLAQAPSWAWAKCAGGNHLDQANCVALDSTGNIYVVGSFRSDSITFGTTTLINAFIPNYTVDIFIVKYDANGNVIWAKSAGGKEHDEPTGIAVDNFNNIYITGYFDSDTINFGSISLTKDTSNISDLFIAKYDTDGNIIWAKSAGGIYDDEANGIAIDKTGNIYITGYFNSDSISFDSYTLQNVYGRDVFIAKYNTFGNVLWAKSAGGNGLDYATCVTTDEFGNTYLAGSFESDSISFGLNTLQNVGMGCMFIAKYNSTGDVLWAKKAGGNNVAYATSVSADISGNIYATGSFNGNIINFGSISLFNNSYSGAYDMFVAKYNSGGNIIWAKNPKGKSDDFSNSISIDNAGYIYICGYFNSDTLAFGATFLLNLGFSDIFAAKYDTNGSIVWAKNVSGSQNERSSSIVSNALGNSFIVGFFTDNAISFDTYILNNYGIYGDPDMFIAKLDATAGIVNYANENNTTVYPNPSNGDVTIEIMCKKREDITITLYNVIGEKVYNETVNNAFGIFRKNINISDLSSGIYIIQVNTKDYLISKKLIKN